MATQPSATNDSKQGITPRQNDWTKPAAMAIPKEGYFKNGTGRYGPIFPRPPPAMASRSSRRSSREERRSSASTAKNIEKSDGRPA